MSQVRFGTDNLDLSLMAARGVWAGNAASAFTNPTADCALALLLAVTRRITEADTYVRAGRWTSFQPGVWDGALLAGKTLGIVGYGRIGQAVGRRAAAFDLRVIHTSRTRTQDPGYRTLDALCAEVDIVCLALPLNADSQRLFDAARLARLKRGAFLINVARGKIVEEAALVAALRSGQLGGAGLDVFENEPAVNPALLTMKNVVLLPHIGGGTTESRSEARSLAVGQRCRRAPRPRAAFTCESASGVSPCHSRMNGAHTPRIASTSFELAFAAMPLVAIIRLTAPHDLRPVAAALQAARVGCLEVTLTTPYAIESIAALRAEFGDALQIGAGTILDEKDARIAVGARAQFIVTPTLQLDSIALCQSRSVPIICGAYTPTEALQAQRAGADFVKLFPAASLGPEFVRAMLAPLPHLRIVPTGGITPETIPAWLHAGCVGVAVGSNLVNDAVVAAHDWSTLRETTQRFVSAIDVSRATSAQTS